MGLASPHQWAVVIGDIRWARVRIPSAWTAYIEWPKGLFMRRVWGCWEVSSIGGNAAAATVGAATTAGQGSRFVSGGLRHWWSSLEPGRDRLACSCPHRRTPGLLSMGPQETFEYYSKASGHGSEAKQLAAFDRFGPNVVDVPLPAFSELMKEHLIAPFFVFQVRPVVRASVQCMVTVKGSSH